MPPSFHRSRLRAVVRPSPFLPARAIDPVHLREQVLAIAVAVAAASVLAGNGVAAIGSTLDEEQRTAALPRPQSYSVSAAAPIAPALREDFTVTWTPPVVYPLGPGAEQTDGFGHRIAPCPGCSTDHKGVDWTPGEGTPVGSIADGVVTAVGYDGTFGLRVEIEHVIDGQAVTTLSAHLQDGSVPVSVDQTVEVGQLIGAVGSTGQSTGPHLHFEIHVGGAPINPVPWLAENVRTEPR
ncbi:hypothetical protein GCM10009792_05160 [Microcella alkalica]|uniref:Murein DD-endopeptidase MepM/ murein hydrolase activator NlpD n=1 Tax=Microcella alkalica TaxID=355930 RepID=A0A839E1S5_9MICO|nr:M23 family metallopeptidase [Microcella alkalica]MBA8846639.1 murein DD-endopeptidase MepM/ murein hydrolase activator NlpD [Microcella alkalica]